MPHTSERVADDGERESRRWTEAVVASRKARWPTVPNPGRFFPASDDVVALVASSTCEIR